MSEFIQEGEFVDGKKCSVYTRRVDFKGPHLDPLTNRMMMLYELSRNCSVEITQEHGEDIERRSDVHYLVGDKIKGGAIQLWVDTRRDNVNFEVSEGVTSTHGGHLANTSKRTIGMIKYSFKIYDNLLGYTAKPKLKSR